MPLDPSPDVSARQQLILDYKATFAGTRGARVLEDLQRVYGWDKPTAGPGITLEEVYRRECMKHPVYHIRAMLASEVRPDPKKAKPSKATSSSPAND